MLAGTGGGASSGVTVLPVRFTRAGGATVTLGAWFRLTPGAVPLATFSACIAFDSRPPRFDAVFPVALAGAGAFVFAIATRLFASGAAAIPKADGLNAPVADD